MGAVPVVVHTMYRTFQDMGESFWERSCQSLLSSCRALAICVSHRDFMRSAGTALEFSWAVATGKPVFYSDVPAADAVDGTVLNNVGTPIHTIESSGREGCLGLEYWIREQNR